MFWSNMWSAPTLPHHLCSQKADQEIWNALHPKASSVFPSLCTRPNITMHATAHVSPCLVKGWLMGSRLAHQALKHKIMLIESICPVMDLALYWQWHHELNLLEADECLGVMAGVVLLIWFNFRASRCGISVVERSKVHLNDDSSRKSYRRIKQNNAPLWCTFFSFTYSTRWSDWQNRLLRVHYLGHINVLIQCLGTLPITRTGNTNSICT